MSTPFSLTDANATISTTEYSLPAASTTLTAQTTACTMQAFIDFGAMLAGDQYRVTVYESINGGSQLAVYIADLIGVQQGPFVTPMIMVGNGWNVTVKKIAGTDRTIKWSIRKDTGDRNAASVAAGAVTSIVAGVLAGVYEGSRTVQDFLRLGAAVLWGKATGLEGSSPTYRDDADSKNRVVASYSSGARTPSTRDAT